MCLLQKFSTRVLVTLSASLVALTILGVVYIHVVGIFPVVISYVLLFWVLRVTGTRFKVARLTNSCLPGTLLLWSGLLTFGAIIMAVIMAMNRIDMVMDAWRWLPLSIGIIGLILPQFAFLIRGMSPQRGGEEVKGKGPEV